ncbi:MAG: hypothetical protein ACKVU1_15685 [bacterium]
MRRTRLCFIRTVVAASSRSLGRARLRICLPAMTAVLLVACDDGDNSPITQVPDESPVCEVAPDTIDLGWVPIGHTVERSFTIQNAGGGSLAGVVAAYCPRFSIVGEREYLLAAGQIDTFTVRFAPTIDGDRSCKLNTGPTTCVDIVANGFGYVAPSGEGFAATVTRELAGRYEVTTLGSAALDTTDLCIGDYVFSFGYRGYFDSADNCSTNGTPENFTEWCRTESVGDRYIRWTQYGTGQLRGDTLFLAGTYTYYRRSQSEGTVSATTRVVQTLVRIGDPSCP